jgi:hypothetical protein
MVFGGLAAAVGLGPIAETAIANAAARMILLLVLMSAQNTLGRLAGGGQNLLAKVEIRLSNQIISLK